MLLLHPWTLRAVSGVPGLHMEPTLAGKESRSPVFAQGGEPSRVLIAHSCWWEGEEATCRQGRDPQQASLLFTQLQKPLELAKGTHRVNANHLQQRGGAASGWTRSVGMHGGFRKLTAKAEPRIPCAAGGNKEVIRSGFP